MVPGKDEASCERNSGVVSQPLESYTSSVPTWQQRLLNVTQYLALTLTIWRNPWASVGTADSMAMPAIARRQIVVI